MKIGILTQPLGHNYGGLLQNWALQMILKEMNHEPLTIVYYGLTPFQKLKSDVNVIVLYVIKHLLRHPSRSLTCLPWKKVNKFTNLWKFLNKHIVRSKVIKKLSYRSLCKYKLDVIIVGSDQVWRPLYNKNRLKYMFGIFEDSNTNGIRFISYAASFGVSDWEYSVNDAKLANAGIKNFQAISVREESGIKLCKKYLKKEAKLVLDPTLLLESKYYVKLLADKDVAQCAGAQVGVYFLDMTEKKMDIVREVCSAMDLHPVFYGTISTDTGKYMPVESWLAMFIKSKFVITDSFHGTAFSINFNVPFISIINSSRGRDRFASILNFFNLRTRMVEEYEIGRARNLIFDAINWREVNKKLREQRIISHNFLRSALDEK